MAGRHPDSVIMNEGSFAGLSRGLGVYRMTEAKTPYSSGHASIPEVCQWPPGVSSTSKFRAVGYLCKFSVMSCSSVSVSDPMPPPTTQGTVSHEHPVSHVVLKRS